ncbi:MAG: hypothetical protein AABX02_03160 [archaeon]
MRLLHVLLFIGIISSGLVVSADGTDAQSIITTSFTPNGELSSALAAQLPQANAHFQTIPRSIRALFANQRIQVDLILNDGRTEAFEVVTTTDSIESITRHPPANPTMKLTLTEETARTIAWSENPLGSFIHAINSGNVRYELIPPRIEVRSVLDGTVGFFSQFISSIRRMLAG